MEDINTARHKLTKQIQSIPPLITTKIALQPTLRSMMMLNQFHELTIDIKDPYGALRRQVDEPQPVAELS